MEINAPERDTRGMLDSLLLASLEVKSSLFRLGQYCGDNWSATLSGQPGASFHLVLRGTCRLELDSGPDDDTRLLLREGDGIFFLRDTGHRLVPEHGLQGRGARTPMQPLEPALPGATALASGYFELRTGLGDLLADGLPDRIIMRAGDSAYDGARSVFQLILAETGQQPGAALVERLAGLLIFYVLRHAAQGSGVPDGVLALAREPALRSVLEAIMADPGAAWSVQAMAARAYMSPATFHRRVALVGGCTPLQLLQYLRVRVAKRLLSAGASISQAAAEVGYDSTAAFSRLFQKLTGEPPSAWRRAGSPR